MEVIYHRTFLKNYEKLSPKIQTKFEECLQILHNNPFDSILHNHLLMGKWRGFRSINITGDWRAIYLPIDANTAKFYAIGTHSQLYG